jgi:hypothetical protein
VLLSIDKDRMLRKKEGEGRRRKEKGRRRKKIKTNL